MDHRPVLSDFNSTRRVIVLRVQLDLRVICSARFRKVTQHSKVRQYNDRPLYDKCTPSEECHFPQAPCALVMIESISELKCVQQLIFSPNGPASTELCSRTSSSQLLEIDLLRSVAEANSFPELS